MINKIQINGFKRFSEQAFDIKNLTLLSGLNGAGKSSFIQGLILTREAAKNEASIPLDTPFGVNLGTTEDVINWYSEDSNIILKVEESSEATHQWKLGEPEPYALYLTVQERPSASLPFALQKIPRAFTYLCADRIVPKTMYQLSPCPVDDLEIGLHGENVVQLLEAVGNTDIRASGRLHPRTKEEDVTFLIYQVEMWMNDIVRPIQIKAEKMGSNTISTLKFKSDGGEWVQSTNMGFGVSYVLPIIVAGLLVKAGGMLIVENPEAHLHPAGQSNIGAFLGWLAGKGVQVIVETHSDHVLNGIRRAIADYKYINSNDACVIFFDVDGSVSTLEFTKQGGISSWPKSFFDQYQLDTIALGKLRRSKIGTGICS